MVEGQTASDQMTFELEVSDEEISQEGMEALKDSAFAVKDENDNNPKDDPKDDPADDPKDTSDDNPKDDPKDNPSDDPKDEPSDEPSDEPKDEPTDDLKDKSKDEPKDDSADSPKGDKLSLNLPDDSKKDEGASDATWGDIAGDIGFETKSEDFDGFKKDLNSYVDKKVSDAVGKAEVDQEAVLSKMTPEAKKVVEYLNSEGGSLDNLHSATVEHDKILSMNDNALVQAEFEANDAGFTAEEVDKKISDLEEKGELVTFAKEIRGGITTKRNEVISDLVERQEKLVQETQAETEKLDQENTNAMRKTLDNTKEFLGAPVSDSHRDAIMNDWESGVVDDLINDPEFIKEALFYHKFGKDLFEQAKRSSFDGGKEKVKKDLHNIPSDTSAGSGRTETSSDTKEGFAAWGDINNDDNVTVERGK